MSAPFHHIAHILIFITTEGWGRAVIFLFGREGGCQKIMYDVGEIKKFCPSKKYPLIPPIVYIMNAAFV